MDRVLLSGRAEDSPFPRRWKRPLPQKVAMKLNLGDFIDGPDDQKFRRRPLLKQTVPLFDSLRSRVITPEVAHELHAFQL